VPPAVSTPAETPATADAALKPLKIAAAMARVALQKAERQLAQYGTPALEAQVQQLREAAEQAQVALDSAQRGAATARAPALATPATDPAALKQARIAATLARAQLTKAERAFGSAPTPEQSAQLATLRGAAQQAAHRLAALETPTRP